MKRLIIIGTVLSFLLLILPVVFFFAPFMAGDVGREEIKRLPSPDSSIDAVMVRLNGGATTTFWYNVYIVPAGTEPVEGREIFSVAYPFGLSLQWQEPTLLEIHYERAQIYHYRNFWSSQEVAALGNIEIRLIQDR